MSVNVGEKIMKLAQVLLWLGIGCSVIAGLHMLVLARVLTGLLVVGLGILTSWITSLILCAFGELIDNVSDINYRISDDTKKSEENTNKIIKAIKEKK